MLTEKEIIDIIDSELESYLIDEGLKDKITKGLAAAALAGGLGFGTPAQATPDFTSTETPITQVAESGTARNIEAKLKKKGIDGFSAAELQGIGQRLDKAFMMSNVPKENLEDWAVNFITDSINDIGASKKDTIKAVETAIQKTLDKRAKKPEMKRTVTRTDMRRSDLIIQQAVYGVFMARDQAALDKAGDVLVKELAKGVKDITITREEAREILTLSQSSKNADKINKILGLQKN